VTNCRSGAWLSLLPLLLLLLLGEQFCVLLLQQLSLLYSLGCAPCCWGAGNPVFVRPGLLYS
jgi:hypothetical protein